MQTSPRNKEEKNHPAAPAATRTRDTADGAAPLRAALPKGKCSLRGKEKKDQHQNRRKITVFSTLSVPARQADALPRSGTKLMFLSHAEPSTILALQTTAACFSAETLRAPLDIIIWKKKIKGRRKVYT